MKSWFQALGSWLQRTLRCNSAHGRSFCDVDPDTWCMRATDVASVVTEKTRVIVAVHSYGNVCEMSDLLALAHKRQITVIEDAAEAFGSRISDRPAGSLGKISTFSFHATKTIATGEGGLVATDDATVAETMRLYRSHGLRRRRHYWHEVPGQQLSPYQPASGSGVRAVGEHQAHNRGAPASIFTLSTQSRKSAGHHTPALHCKLRAAGVDGCCPPFGGGVSAGPRRSDGGHGGRRY